MKTVLIALMLMFSVGCAHGYADDYYIEESENVARVVRIEPNFREVITGYHTRITCNRGAYAPTYHERGNSGRTATGAIIGGLIGTQIGDGNGQLAATIVGATAGAVIGERSGRQHRERGYDERYDRYVRHGRQCYEVREPIIRRVRDGYTIHYIYRDHRGYRHRGSIWRATYPAREASEGFVYIY